MAAPDVVEILLNPDGSIWVDRLGRGMERAGVMAFQTAEALIGTVASTLRTTVTRENPILECELPLSAPFMGARFEAMIPPIVGPGPAFAIRRRASSVYTLDQYVTDGIMTPAQCDAIKLAVRGRKNIIVGGGTGSGKTTLVNAILHFMAEVSTARVVVIEDTSELQCSAENAVILREVDTVSMLRLLKATMRLRPDRIVVGEVRSGDAALAMLKAWNTGHPGGVCTTHCNTHVNAARACLTRIEQLIREVSTSPMRDLIAEAVDLIVSIARADNEPGRLVQEVVCIDGLAADGSYNLSPAE